MTSFLFLKFEKKITQVIGKLTTESIGKNSVNLFHGYIGKFETIGKGYFYFYFFTYFLKAILPILPMNYLGNNREIKLQSFCL